MTDLYFAKRWLAWVAPDGNGLTDDVQFAGLFAAERLPALRAKSGTTIHKAADLLGMIAAKREEAAAAMARLDALAARVAGGHPMSPHCTDIDGVPPP